MYGYHVKQIDLKTTKSFEDVCVPSNQVFDATVLESEPGNATTFCAEFRWEIALSDFEISLSDFEVAQRNSAKQSDENFKV